MCRFVAYLGQEKVVLADIIDKPSHSLLNQSRAAKEDEFRINADGFGIGWYDHSFDELPGLFKSIQPAWNDRNLVYLMAKTRSKCFVAHVRASTVGDVASANCHPFAYQQFLFAHNGTIREFDNIKKYLVELLDQDLFLAIQGQTDSEWLFMLIMQYLRKQPDQSIQSMGLAMQQAVATINQLQAQHNNKATVKINSVLSNGKEMLITRYVQSQQPLRPLSLYFTTLQHQADDKRFKKDTESTCGVLVASEPLDDYADYWQLVNENTMLMIDQGCHIHEQPLK